MQTKLKKKKKTVCGDMERYAQDISVGENKDVQKIMQSTLPFV